MSNQNQIWFNRTIFIVFDLMNFITDFTWHLPDVSIQQFRCSARYVTVRCPPILCDRLARLDPERYRILIFPRCDPLMARLSACRFICYIKKSHLLRSSGLVQISLMLLDLGSSTLQTWCDFGWWSRVRRSEARPFGRLHVCHLISHSWTISSHLSYQGKYPDGQWLGACKWEKGSAFAQVLMNLET
jgi:hypothetical protein